jgi:hypothetical protein
MGPTEAEQVVTHGFGKVAEDVAVFVDGSGAVALGELLAVWAVDQRDMAVVGLGPAHAVIDRQLAEGIQEVVVAANDVGDAHVVIVDHHGQHVGGRAVGAEQDQVVDVGIGARDCALHVVGDGEFADVGHAEADDRRCAGGKRAGWVAPGGAEGTEEFGHAGGVCIRQAAFGGFLLLERFGLVAAGLKLLGGDGAMVCGAAFHQLVGNLGVARGALGLEHGRLVAAEAEPVEAVEDGVDGGLGGPLLVRVLDPEQELAAFRAGV